VVRCPACSAELADGVLRCRLCGADARGAGGEGPPAFAGLRVEQLLPEAQRVEELMREFYELAPEVLAWWRAAPREKKARLYEILTEMREIIRARKG
jgi:hypothetical protein